MTSFDPFHKFKIFRDLDQGSAKVRAARGPGWPGPEFRAPGRARAKFLKIPGSGPVPG